MLNPKVMEVWLNDILEEAQELGLKSWHLKPDKRKPISLYGIDRQTLGKHGLSTELVNRVYRGLFVYSVGFFQLLKKCADHAKNKTSLVASIWRVFAILLEFCWKTDYDILISEITRQYQDETAKLKAQIESIKIASFEKEQKIMEKCEFLKITAENMDKKTSQYVKHIEKLNEYIDDLRKRNEEEINIRKQFEAKLNELHSVGRDQETKYYRALEEIDDYMQKAAELDKNLKTFEKETMELRKTKISLDTQLAISENKSKSFHKENININRMLALKEKRISELDQENQKNKQEALSAQKKVKDLTLKHEISELKHKKLLEDAVTLTAKLDKEQSITKTQESKIEELSNQLEDANRSAKQFERELSRIVEKETEFCKKNLDLNNSLEELTEKYQSLTIDHKALYHKHEQFCKIYEELKANYDVWSATLEKTTKERQRLYEDAVRGERIIIQQEKDIKELKGALELEQKNYGK